MPYTTNTIGYALEQVNPTSPRFFIPAMQRPYVWEKEDVVKLFTSIYLQLPIGTSLVWPTKYHNPQNLGAARAYWIPHTHGNNPPPAQAALDEGQEITLVLDGQQRITSLNLGIRGHWINGERELTLCFDPTVRCSPNLYESPVHKQAFKFIDLDNDDIKQLITCRRIIDWKNSASFESWLTQYMNMHSSNQNLRPEEIESNIRKLRSSFWEVEAYCYGEYPAQNVEDALNVFQLANDTGKALDKTDLILATLQISWSTGALREDVPEVVRELNGMFAGRHQPFDQKKLLNLFFLTADCEIPSAYRLKDFTPAKIEKLKEYWPTFKNEAKKLIEQLQRWGITNNRCVSSINALIPILRWQVKNSFSYLTEDQRLKNEVEKIRQWLLIVLLNGSFGGQSTRTITAARDVIENSAESTFPKVELFTRLEDFHNHDFITKDGIARFLNDLSYGSDKNNIRRMLILLKDNMLDSNFNYDIDHIFPQANYQNYTAQLDSIANLQLLTRRENTVKSNNNPAILWNSEVFSDEWRKENALSETPEPENGRFIYDDPERFWKKRNNTLLNKLFKVLELDSP